MNRPQPPVIPAFAGISVPPSQRGDHRGAAPILMLTNLPRCAFTPATNVSLLMEVDVCVTTLEHHP